MTVMTRAHFVFIAETIAAMPDHSLSLRAAKEATARHFARHLLKTNARFDPDRFIEACNIPTLDY